MSAFPQRFAFDGEGDGGGLHQAVALDLPDGELTLITGFLGPAGADRLLDELVRTTPWRQEAIKLYGRESPVPRLTSWHGDPGAGYTYSNIAMQPEPWSSPLLEIRARVEEAASVSFNSVLCNLYRDGRDSVGWHSDDEAELGTAAVIASVSLGDTRTFQFRHRERPELRRQVELVHDSLLIMGGATQRWWRHQVPKTARRVGPRVNLTYRTVRPAVPNPRAR